MLLKHLLNNTVKMKEEELKSPERLLRCSQSYSELMKDPPPNTDIQISVLFLKVKCCPRTHFCQNKIYIFVSLIISLKKKLKELLKNIAVYCPDKGLSFCLPSVSHMLLFTLLFPFQVNFLFPANKSAEISHYFI